MSFPNYTTADTSDRTLDPASLGQQIIADPLITTDFEGVNKIKILKHKTIQVYNGDKMSKHPANVSVKPRHKNDNDHRMIKRFMKKVKKYKVLEKYRETLRYQKPSDKKRKERKKREKVLDKLKAEEKKYMEADFNTIPKPKKKRRRQSR